MADDKDKTAGSASKSPEQKDQQTQAKSTAQGESKAGKTELEHGQPKGDAAKAEREIIDPSTTLIPAQMLVDNQDPAVDPRENEPSKGGADLGRSVKVNPLEPGKTPEDAESAPEGGTNAPA